jgi:hypothetical protein
VHACTHVGHYATHLPGPLVGLMTTNTFRRLPSRPAAVVTLLMSATSSAAAAGEDAVRGPVFRRLREGLEVRRCAHGIYLIIHESGTVREGGRRNERGTTGPPLERRSPC